ncbi:MAG: RDD family protein [Flavobacterium sp.]
MLQKSDKELIRITTVDAHRYQPEALESAKKELESRNIDATKYNEISDQFTVQQHADKSLELNKADTGKRFVHLIIDFIVFAFAYRLTGEFFQLIFDINIYRNITPYIFFMLFAFLMTYGFMEYKFQKTVGKFITKTKVVTLNGEKPGMGDILSRTFSRLIPFDRFSYLFSANGFHDRISNTIVINDTLSKKL